MKRDVEKTNNHRFKDSRSYITKDSREVLYGADWDDRRFELLQRSRGQCEYMRIAIFGPDEFVRCLQDAQDPHHKILRSVERDDRLTNLLAVCRHHHKVLDREQRKERNKR